MKYTLTHSHTLSHTHTIYTGRRIFVTAPDLPFWVNHSTSSVVNTTLRTLLLPLDSTGQPLYRTTVGVRLNASVDVNPQQSVGVHGGWGKWG